jgi:hypothetical protein
MRADHQRAFTPKPWQPLTGPLFNVTPPDEMDDPCHEDDEWYRILCQVTGIAIRHNVNEVHRNYTEGIGTRFGGRAVGFLEGVTLVISSAILDGEPTVRIVHRDLGRLVKTVGLVTYDPTPGPRRNWPMAPRKIGLDEAVAVADHAFHGRYPNVGQAEEASRGIAASR